MGSCSSWSCPSLPLQTQKMTGWIPGVRDPEFPLGSYSFVPKTNRQGLEFQIFFKPLYQNLDFWLNGNIFWCTGNHLLRSYKQARKLIFIQKLWRVDYMDTMYCICICKSRIDYVGKRVEYIKNKFLTLARVCYLYRTFGSLD